MCLVALCVTAFAVFLHLSQAMTCYVYFPGAGNVSRNDFEDPEMFEFDRNVYIESCPTEEQWMAQQTTVAA
ncbi:hypothetical protein TELCIR_01325 [Teladorsagia circumcincta]|uniref:Uncharacterized protein n=1 Tax=Teladorsagia circumcincta TaxID=45464 RepID=A0A2G9V276_TELCI|nr:hypothetical protein TELCIR_01325 [Teladorsagia circumcincta]